MLRSLADTEPSALAGREDVLRCETEDDGVVGANANEEASAGWSSVPKRGSTPVALTRELGLKDRG